MALRKRVIDGDGPRVSGKVWIGHGDSKGRFREGSVGKNCSSYLLPINKYDIILFADGK